MQEVIKFSIVEHFTELEDPRIERGKKHSLIDIITISICAVISGSENWIDMQDYAREKEDFFKSFLELKNGIPSHDTFRRVFSLINPKKFQECYTEWIQAISGCIDKEHIAIDGKTLRRSFDQSSGIKAMHLVNAWSCTSSFILAQKPVNDKSNEITAIPDLLEMFCVRGCILTLDAMGAQKKIATKIVDKKGDYIFGLKENNKNLYKDVKKFFSESSSAEFVQSCKDVDSGHGRIETRECFVASAGMIKGSENWEGIKSVALIKSSREVRGKITTEQRCFISSLEPDCELIAKTVRNHWGIENTLHWNLDMNFAEDRSRVREKNSAENLAMLRRIVVGLIKNEPSKMSIRRKIKKACMNDKFLLQILGVQKK